MQRFQKQKHGVDGVTLRKNADKMRATIRLNNGKYIAKPLKYFTFKDEKAGKERTVGVPTVYDRAMQVLYSYALEPISEAMADRKSFAFRKGRSTVQAHSFIMHALTDIDATEWVLITDIKSYYASISHRWLIENIPTHKSVLKQFLKCGYIFKNEVFEINEGISLGSNLATILGNMTLDGLQYELYSLQGRKVQDYKNGYCVRFADDICVTARTKQDAEQFRRKIEIFLAKRGLKLSEEKTKIVNIKEGFEFISRYYCKVDGIIRCIPSNKAVKNFEMEVERLIFSSEKNWSQRKLIMSLNAKITGFATYHKCEESTEVFKHLDVIINALLLKFMRKMYPKVPMTQLQNKYWKKDSLERRIFAIPTNKNICVQCMEDIILVQERRIDASKNVFLDREYFEDIEKNRDIQNVVGRFRRVWDRQGGKCFICHKKINREDEKKIIYMKSSKDKSIKNMAYIHLDCENSANEYIKVKDTSNSIGIRQLIQEIEQVEISENIKEGKFFKLTEYFHNVRKNKVILKFKDIEKICNCKLCDTAYKRASYFNDRRSGGIARNWENQGYKLVKIDMQNQKLYFEKESFTRRKVVIPKFMYRTNLCMEAVEEIKTFFKHIEEKYRLG